jgi:hypothetical protein
MINTGVRNMKRISRLCLEMVLIGGVVACGGGGGGEANRATAPSTVDPTMVPTPIPVVQQIATRLFSQNYGSIKNIRALDNGFAFAGRKILGGSNDGKTWYSTKVDDNYFDVNGQNGQYSTGGHALCRDKASTTIDGGKTWKEGAVLESCGIEDWPDGSLQYSNNAWVYAGRGTGFSSVDGENYKAILLDKGKTEIENIYLPPTAASVKLSGRTAGDVVFFDSHKCSTYVGTSSLVSENWKQTGVFNVDISAISAISTDTSKMIIKSPCYIGYYVKDTPFAPNKPYVLFNEFDGTYLTAPSTSQAKAWVWTLHYQRPVSDERFRPSAYVDLIIYSMFWAGDTLIELTNNGIYISQDQGNSWDSVPSLDIKEKLRSDDPILSFNSGDWNPRNGIVAVSDGNSVYSLNLPNLINAGVTSLDYSGSK